MSTIEVPMEQAASSEVASAPARGGRGADRAFRAILTMFGLTVLAVPLLMVLELVRSSQLSMEKFGLGFLTSTVWDPAREEFGALPFIYGTLVSSLIAILLAVPVSLGLAIFLSDLAPHRIRKPLGFLVELLAAIPSVVYGFWGVAVLVPWLRDTIQPFIIQYFGYLPLFEGPPLGFGMFAAGVILAIMIVPTITSVSREVMQAVPQLHREAAIGLGASAWDTIRYAVLPSARSGIIGAIILGLNRALGETMAVTMVIGNRPQVSASIFQPGYSMASVIANEFVEAPSDVYVSALSEIALLLFGVALLLNLFARWLVSSTKSKLEGRA
ncbi:phosphate ABC transporter permease [Sorangium cellulosum]|uniref:Phosphate transport system permease protein n=1 Tax=Sorangium cellulosum TaxID=56 RepID=A0A4P2PZ33_SORCE|nr:phosphate ABC transporter permease subunit PstC [Sorangium cellulosum]AUX22157.1 phosphate ABC transporter permease [Sorangium cellulosum]